MREQHASWPKRFIRWMFGGMFQRIPPPYGNVVPPELQRFEAEAEDARHHGVGDGGRAPRIHHGKTVPARNDSSLERQ